MTCKYAGTARRCHTRMFTELHVGELQTYSNIYMHSEITSKNHMATSGVGFAPNFIVDVDAEGVCKSKSYSLMSSFL